VEETKIVDRPEVVRLADSMYGVESWVQSRREWVQSGRDKKNCRPTWSHEVMGRIH